MFLEEVDLSVLMSNPRLGIDILGRLFGGFIQGSHIILFFCLCQSVHLNNQFLLPPPTISVLMIALLYYICEFTFPYMSQIQFLFSIPCPHSDLHHFSIGYHLLSVLPGFILFLLHCLHHRITMIIFLKFGSVPYYPAQKSSVALTDKSLKSVHFQKC